MAPNAIGIIASNARDFGLTVLKPNHVRHFRQPWGYMELGIDVDLLTGTLLRYPESHSEVIVPEEKADSENFTRLKSLLESDAFRLLPAENRAFGNDGVSDFIEANLNGVYY